MVIKRNGSFICSGIKLNGLYVITPNFFDESIMELNNSMVTVPTKRKEAYSNPIRLWHMRLGHINLNRISRLVKEGVLGDLVLKPMEVYESCLEGKMTKRLFPTKGNRTNALLELVHTDVCGPINIRARGSYEYFITFLADHSRYGYMYLMQHKSKTFKSSKSLWLKLRNN